MMMAQVWFYFGISHLHNNVSRQLCCQRVVQVHKSVFFVIVALHLHTVELPPNIVTSSADLGV